MALGKCNLFGDKCPNDNLVKAKKPYWQANYAAKLGKTRLFFRLEYLTYPVSQPYSHRKVCLRFIVTALTTYILQ